MEEKVRAVYLLAWEHELVSIRKVPFFALA